MNKIYFVFFVTSIFLINTSFSQTKLKIPNATVIVVRTKDMLSSDKLKAGQELILSVATDVKIKERIVIKADAPVFATVQSGEAAGMVGQAGELVVSFMSTSAVDGTSIALSGNFIAKGGSKVGESVAVGVICCPLALLASGGEGEIPAGAQARGIIVGEYEVTVSN